MCKRTDQSSKAGLIRQLLYYIVVSLLFQHVANASDNEQIVSDVTLPRYLDRLPGDQPGSASPWKKTKIKFKSVREFPWKHCKYYFDVWGGPGSPWIGVKNGSNEFEDPESYYFFASDVIYLDIDKNGIEEAALLTDSSNGSTIYSSVGIFALDPEEQNRVYLVSVIPGAANHYSNNENHIKSMTLDNGSLVIRRLAKDEISKRTYRIESWVWNGKQMVQDESKLRIEIEEKRKR